MINIGGYEPDEFLGQGAHGVTYKAKKDGGTFALKVVRCEPDDAQKYEKYFHNEVAALKRVEGSHVASFYGAGMELKDGGEVEFFIAMEYVVGVSLGRLFSRQGKTLAEKQLKEILDQIVSALETIHNAKVVHRDLHPWNILVVENRDKDGNRHWDVTVVDFGTAKLLKGTTPTTTTELRGHKEFRAPEAMDEGPGGKRQFDYRADFYSLGVLMYYLVTQGMYPRRDARGHEKPDRPTTHNPSLSRQFDDLIMQLLERDPEKRECNHSDVRSRIQRTPVTIRRSWQAAWLCVYALPGLLVGAVVGTLLGTLFGGEVLGAVSGGLLGATLRAAINSEKVRPYPASQPASHPAHSPVDED